jgi:hypothetical protein
MERPAVVHLVHRLAAWVHERQPSFGGGRLMEEAFVGPAFSARQIIGEMRFRWQMVPWPVVATHMALGCEPTFGAWTLRPAEHPSPQFVLRMGEHEDAPSDLRLGRAPELRWRTRCPSHALRMSVYWPSIASVSPFPCSSRHTWAPPPKLVRPQLKRPSSLRLRVPARRQSPR